MTQQSIAVERYYTVINPKWIGAEILPNDHEPSQGYPAELKEIARAGAVLLLGAPPKLEGPCRLSLASRKLDQPLVAPARINWLRPNAAGEWQLGCAIHPPLSSETFKKLLDSGLLERRATPREPARIEVQAQLAPAKARVPAMVRNISEGGLCCLTTNCPPESTRHVCIFAMLEGSEVRIPLKVRWSMHAGVDYFIGCQFVRQTDFAVLRKLQLEQLHARQTAPALMLSSADTTG